MEMIQWLMPLMVNNRKFFILGGPRQLMVAAQEVPGEMTTLQGTLLPVVELLEIQRPLGTPQQLLDKASLEELELILHSPTLLAAAVARGDLARISRAT